jgi:hypothetical protein
MSETEDYFAYLERHGQIQLAYWAKTLKEAQKKAVEWAKLSAEQENDVNCGIAHIVSRVVPKKKNHPTNASKEVTKP